MVQKSKSSQQWLNRQHSDLYCQQAKKLGYRSRSAFKLLEIQKRDHIFQKGMTVIDLGAAPGGWSQVAKKLVGQSGKVFALDKLPMDPIPGVDIVIGDFQEEAVMNQLLGRLHHSEIDLILSDMAPNLSGNKSIDQPRSLQLAEDAFDFALKVLRDGGTFLVKLFQGEGVTGYSAMLKEYFSKVIVRKPESSRKESREIYILAKNFSKLGKSENYS